MEKVLFMIDLLGLQIGNWCLDWRFRVQERGKLKKALLRMAFTVPGRFSEWTGRNAFSCESAIFRFNRIEAPIDNFIHVCKLGDNGVNAEGLSQMIVYIRISADLFCVLIQGWKQIRIGVYLIPENISGACRKVSSNVTACTVAAKAVFGHDKIPDAVNSDICLGCSGSFHSINQVRVSHRFPLGFIYAYILSFYHEISHSSIYLRKKAEKAVFFCRGLAFSPTAC